MSSTVNQDDVIQPSGAVRIERVSRAAECQTLQDFHDFFAAIPEEEWCTGVFQNSRGQCCARGFVGPATLADTRLMDLAPYIAGANNGYYFDATGVVDLTGRGEDGSTPRSRVLAYLKLRMEKEAKP